MISIMVPTLKNMKIIPLAVMVKNQCVVEEFSKLYKTYFGKDAIVKFLYDMVDEKGYCCQVIESNRIVIERELNKPLPMIKKKIMEILKNLLNAEFVKIHLNR